MNGQEIARSIIDETGEPLPDPIPLDKQDAGEIWDKADAIERAAWIQKGFAASCVAVKYGEESLAEFAREKKADVSTVQNYRRVYRRLMSLQLPVRVDIQRGIANGALSYSHLLAANKLPDDTEYSDVLSTALNDGWGKRQVAEDVAQRVGQRNVVTASEPEPPATHETREDAFVEVSEACPHCEGSGRVVTRRRGRGFGRRRRSA
jgi:hypothetical protein